jgi:hypothetical protein
VFKPVILCGQVQSATVVALEKAAANSCGSKAAACSQLATLAAGASFKTPAGVCLPFGSMDVAIKVCPSAICMP